MPYALFEVCFGDLVHAEEERIAEECGWDDAHNAKYSVVEDVGYYESRNKGYRDVDDTGIGHGEDMVPMFLPICIPDMSAREIRELGYPCIWVVVGV